MSCLTISQSKPSDDEVLPTAEVDWLSETDDSFLLLPQPERAQEAINIHSVAYKICFFIFAPCSIALIGVYISAKAIIPDIPPIVKENLTPAPSAGEGVPDEHSISYSGRSLLAEK